LHEFLLQIKGAFEVGGLFFDGEFEFLVDPDSKFILNATGVGDNRSCLKWRFMDFHCDIESTMWVSHVNVIEAPLDEFCLIL